MKNVGILLTLAVGLLVARPAWAGDGCGAANRCAHCGCGAPCQQVSCQVVAGVTKVKKHCWCVETAPIAPPLPGCLPSLLGGLLGGCGSDCCDNGCCKDCLVPPKCGHIRTQKILVKKEYDCEVPIFKIEVKYLCSGCCADPAVIGPPGPLPAPVPGPMPSAPTPAPPPAPAPGQQASDFIPLPPS